MVLPNTRHQIAIITVKNRPLNPTAQLFVNGVHHETPGVMARPAGRSPNGPGRSLAGPGAGFFRKML
jgi:hypothetical protein